MHTTLATYLDDKQAWPTGAQFEADGQQALRIAIQRNGGVDRWITEFPLAREHRHNGPHGYWTDDRIRTELDRVCEGRTTFPGRRYLSGIGLAGMVRAMAHGRGLDDWAHEIGLPRQPRGGIRGPRKRPP